ncbi:hypothetical protein PybrP1_005029 [[Pythium] brassicae (nom. inval.)]|nr:hypothetical protein PybrP1_005029 [[Pythium] brassicae (nom. inval.)]
MNRRKTRCNTVATRHVYADVLTALGGSIASLALEEALAAAAAAAGQLERLDRLEEQEVAVGGAEAPEQQQVEPVERRVALGRRELRAEQRERLQREADAVRLAERAAHERVAHEARAPHEPALRERERT